jgi:ATP-dependent RNA helicase DeaD
MTTTFEMNTETTMDTPVTMPAAETSGPTFESLGVPAQILAALTRINFNTPTPIQAQAIPLALKGRDILGTAQTGTGKTAAFTIPMIAHLLNNPESTALIVAPTRELATQIQQAVLLIADRSFGLRSALMIGGDPMSRQMHALKQNPRIFIGTPGRINDHLKRRSLNLSRTDYLVLDETDRMLDMGFGVQIDQILKFMPQARQTMLFSATLPSYIVKLADKYMNRPERIAVGSTSAPVAKITQETLKVSTAEKYTALTTELNKRNGSVIIFVKTKRGCDRLAYKLEKEEHSVEAIHGDLRQNKRDRVISEFRNSKIRILVATDVAARGLDIPHIEHVINYDLPQCPEDFIHRIGRTGRNGAEGCALSFITGEDGAKWNAIQRLLNPSERGAANEDGPRGGSFRNKGRSKHGRKPEWSGPRRHRKNGPRHEEVPNEARFQHGDARPQRAQQETRSEARPEKREYRAPRPENRDENRGERRPFNRDRKFGGERKFGDRKFGDRPQRSENRDDNRGDRQPRENRDRWGNSDRTNSAPEGIYKPRTEGGYQGKKRPFNKERSFDGNRPRPERSFEKRNDRFKSGGARDERGGNRDGQERSYAPRPDRQDRSDRPARSEYRGDRPKSNYKGGEKRPFNKDGNRDGAPKRSFNGDRPKNLPTYGQERSKDASAGDRPVFKKGKFKPQGRDFKRPNRDVA